MTASLPARRGSALAPGASAWCCARSRRWHRSTRGGVPGHARQFDLLDLSGSWSTARSAAAVSGGSLSFVGSRRGDARWAFHAAIYAIAADVIVPIADPSPDLVERRRWAWGLAAPSRSSLYAATSGASHRDFRLGNGRWAGCQGGQTMPGSASPSIRRAACSLRAGGRHARIHDQRIITQFWAWLLEQGGSSGAACAWPPRAAGPAVRTAAPT